MKIFEQNGKVNFIDENNVLLGYDLQQDCCEHAGWFIEDIPMSLGDYAKKINVYGYAVPQSDTKSMDKDWSGWVFDTSFYKKMENTREVDEGGTVVFKLVDGQQDKFLHLFNCHNGYYSHGFDLEKDKEVILSERI